MTDTHNIYNNKQLSILHILKKPKKNLPKKPN